MPRNSYEIACNEAARNLDQQLASVDSADQKAGILMGFAGILLALLLPGRPTYSLQGVLRIAAETFLLLSVVRFYMSFRAVTMSTGLTPEGFRALIDNASPADDPEMLLNHQLSYLEDAIRSNSALITRKSEHLGKGSVMLLIALILLIVSSFL